MKRFIRRAGILAAAFCIFLAGCGTPMYKLTEEEENLIVAYASGTVAKGNRYMTQGLTYPQPEVEEELPEEPVAEEPEEELERIWIKFYKVDKARTREYGGSGIGLSIVKAIMDAFHRQCGVRNHEDGVEFWFELDSRCQ